MSQLGLTELTYQQMIEWGKPSYRNIPSFDALEALPLGGTLVTPLDLFAYQRLGIDCYEVMPMASAYLLKIPRRDVVRFGKLTPVDEFISSLP